MFENPYGLMHNINLVTNHIRKKVIYEGKDPTNSVLTPIDTAIGQPFLYLNDQYFRAMSFIKDGITYDFVENCEIFYQVGIAVGEFQKLLVDFNPNLLSDTIKDFHDTYKRYCYLEDCVILDKKFRVNSCLEEISKIKKYKSRTTIITTLLKEKIIPTRVCHNDTKINNVMINKLTKKALCLIDLDTVMKGSLLYDYGDCLRLGASLTTEDETDLSKVGINFELFEAFNRGFINEVKNLITKEELNHLVDAYFLMTYEVSIRFLTDYINGDVYFKIDTSRPLLNLDRARNQLKLAEMIYQEQDKLQNIIKKVVKEIYS